MIYKSILEESLQALERLEKLDRNLNTFNKIYSNPFKCSPKIQWYSRKGYSPSRDTFKTMLNKGSWDTYLTQLYFLSDSQHLKIYEKSIQVNQIKNNSTPVFFWESEGILKEIEENKSLYLIDTLKSLKDEFGEYFKNNETKLHLKGFGVHLKVDDFERVLNWLNYQTYSREGIGSEFNSDSNSVNIENEYFKIKKFTNGNWHLKFTNESFQSLIQERKIVSEKIINLVLNKKEGLVVSGETKIIKEQLKEIGLNWYKKGCFWYLRGSRNKDITAEICSKASSIEAVLKDNKITYTSELESPPVSYDSYTIEEKEPFNIFELLNKTENESENSLVTT